MAEETMEERMEPKARSSSGRTCTSKQRVPISLFASALPTRGFVDAMEDDPKAAIKDFEKIVKGEQPPGEWYYHLRGDCVPDLPTF